PARFAAKCARHPGGENRPRQPHVISNPIRIETDRADERAACSYSVATRERVESDKAEDAAGSALARPHVPHRIDTISRDYHLTENASGCFLPAGWLQGSRKVRESPDCKVFGHVREWSLLAKQQP